MGFTRRALFMAGAATLITGTASATCRQIRIPTRVGTFDALAAGPRRGRPVLLLHGFPEYALEWDQQLVALGEAGFRAVAPDQRGYSPGVRPDGIGPYHLDEAVRDVVRMADGLGWLRFDVVGHDWGAMVAWLAAARYPGRIRSVAAISIPHPAAYAEALRVDPAEQEKARYRELFVKPTPIPEDAIRESGPLSFLPPDKAEYYFRRLTTEPGALTAALNWYRANDFRGYEHRLVHTPALLISGDDPYIGDYGVRATPRWVTGRYRHEALTGVGHWIPENAPDTVSTLLLDHLVCR